MPPATIQQQTAATAFPLLPRSKGDLILGEGTQCYDYTGFGRGSDDTDPTRAAARMLFREHVTRSARLGGGNDRTTSSIIRSGNKDTDSELIHTDSSKLEMRQGSWLSERDDSNRSIAAMNRMWTSVTSIILMDGINSRCMQTLSQYNGRLSNLDPSFVRHVRSIMPNQPSARVADFNENISFAMLNQRKLRHLASRSAEKDQESIVADLVDEFENKLRWAVGDDVIDYQGSFLKTEATVPQPAHVDFTWEYLDQEDDKLFIGFFPLSDEGMFLQLWCNTKPGEPELGQMVFVPPGKLLVLPASTVHGGGFRTCESGNPRFHLYIASHGRPLPDHQQNKYTERNNKARELCERLTDAQGLDVLTDVLFK